MTREKTHRRDWLAHLLRHGTICPRCVCISADTARWERAPQPDFVTTCLMTREKTHRRDWLAHLLRHGTICPRCVCISADTARWERAPQPDFVTTCLIL